MSNLFIQTEIKMKAINCRISSSLLLMLLVLLFTIVSTTPANAYDAPWNGGREDITRPDPIPEDDGCEGDECPDDPCDATRSPVYVANGSLIWSDTDITFPAATRVGLKRTYNSFDYRAGLFGRGWVTAQESGIAKTYKAAGGGYISVPIWMTESGMRYTLTDNGSSCSAPGVLFFSFEKRADGLYKQIFEDSNSFGIYSETGYIQESYSDKDGTTVYYEYDEQQRLIKQYDSNGYTLNFTYNEQGFVEEVKDQAERTWNYLYDNFGRIEKVIDPDGNSKDYAYQIVDKIGYKKHLLTEVNDNLSTPVLRVSWAEIILNAGKAMRVTSYTEIDGRPHSYSYNDTSYNNKTAIRTVKTTKQIGSNTTIETQTFITDASSYRVLDETSQKIGLGSTAQKRTFNERGKLIEHLDKRGNTTLYVYNEVGRLIKTTELANTNDERIVVQSYYNNTNRIEVTNEYGLRETRYEYDIDLRIIEQKQIDLTANTEKVWKYTYYSNTTDDQGNTVLGQVASIDGPQLGNQDTETFRYNIQGQLIETKSPLGETISYEYNNIGQQISETDINGVTTRKTYNSKGRVIQSVRNNRIHKYEYNAQGQVTQIEDASGLATEFSYNEQTLPTKISYPSGDYLAISYNYSSTHIEVTRENYSKNNALVSTQVFFLNPNDGFTEEEYLSTTSQLVNKYQRNEQNDIIQVDHFGTYKGTTKSTDNYKYDSLGQLIQINDGHNGITKFGYDVFNRLVQVTDPNQGVTAYTYSAQGDLNQKISPDTGSTQYQYDSAGNVINETNSNNLSVAYTYDALNRLKTIDYQGNDLDTVLTYDQGLNGKGQLTMVEDASSSIQYQYNDRGLAKSINTSISNIAFNTSYSYNETEQIVGMDYPSGIHITYLYDAAGRLNKIQTTDQNNTRVIISDINRNGSNLMSYQQGNGLVTNLTYDGSGRLIEKNFGDTNGLKNKLDNQGLVLEQTWVNDNSTETTPFQYDALGRVIEDGKTGNQVSYDSVNNRLSETQPEKTYDYQSNSSRLTGVGGVNIQRDEAGNTLDDGTRQYQYNAMNRLSILVNSQNNTQANYTYNYLGQRIRKQLSGGENDDILFIYGLQGELLGEYQANGQVIREYIYQTGTKGVRLVAEIDKNGRLFYIHTDHLGTPRLATDQSQVVVWRWDSDVFGKAVANEDVDGDGIFVVINHRFAGQYFDLESNLHYNHYRYYEPKTGRYLTSDPIGLTGGLNTYAYAGANALINTDFHGLAWGSARAVRHFYLGGGATVTLSTIGLKATVTSKIKPLRNKWKNTISARAMLKASSMPCNSSSNKKFSGTAGVHSGSWWVGGVSLSQSADCMISLTCTDALQCPPLKIKTYTFSCSLKYSVHDLFEDPSDFDNSNGGDFWDHWQYGGTPFYVDGTWTGKHSGGGTL